MNATIHTFPNQGDSAHLPSLGEMCHALRENYYKLDEIDRDFYLLIAHVNRLWEHMKPETIIECRAMAWSMLNRYKLAV